MPDETGAHQPSRRPPAVSLEVVLLLRVVFFCVREIIAACGHIFKRRIGLVPYESAGWFDPRLFFRVAPLVYGGN